MRYLLLLVCLLLVACGDEAPPVTPLPTSAPATQTPVVIVVVVTATPEPTKAERPALAATSAPTQPPATASATATLTSGPSPATVSATSPAGSPTSTRRPTGTPRPTGTARPATKTPKPTATVDPLLCSNDVTNWRDARQDIYASLTKLHTQLAAADPESSKFKQAAQQWTDTVSQAQALAAPAGYDRAAVYWQEAVKLWAAYLDKQSMADLLWDESADYYQKSVDAFDSVYRRCKA
jgi:hypothetical protein